MTTRNGPPQTQREALKRWVSAVAAAAIQHGIPPPPNFDRHTVHTVWSATACVNLAVAEGWKTLNAGLQLKAGDSVLSGLRQLDLPE